MAVYDDTAAIGKLYRRQDEIGTPWCVTVDVESLEDGAATIRDRDSMTQERVPIEGIKRRSSTAVRRPAVRWPPPWPVHSAASIASWPARTSTTSLARGATTRAWPCGRRPSRERSPGARRQRLAVEAARAGRRPAGPRSSSARTRGGRLGRLTCRGNAGPQEGGAAVCGDRDDVEGAGGGSSPRARGRRWSGAAGLAGRAPGVPPRRWPYPSPPEMDGPSAAFLKFNTADRGERTRAFRELCKLCGVDPARTCAGGRQRPDVRTPPRDAGGGEPNVVSAAWSCCCSCCC